MRKYVIAGNWKMNKTPAEATALINDLKPLVAGASCDVVVGVPFVDLPAALEATKGTAIGVAAQNCHWEKSGAFTGEVSAEMLKAMEVGYVILGHSERRTYFGDTDVTGQILDLKSKGAECMVVWASDAEYVLTARQAYELGLQVPTVASPAITMDQVRDLCEPKWVEGWYSVTDFVGNSDDPEVTAFCDKYASDYGEGQKAELYVADVYSTFKLVFDAIERAGSADRQAIRDAVAETKDFPMLQGNATCDENNLLVHSATVALIKDNVPVMYTTVSAE